MYLLLVWQPIAGKRPLNKNGEKCELRVIHKKWLFSVTNEILPKPKKEITSKVGPFHNIFFLKIFYRKHFFPRNVLFWKTLLKSNENIIPLFFMNIAIMARHRNNSLIFLKKQLLHVSRRQNRLIM